MDGVCLRFVHMLVDRRRGEVRNFSFHYFVGWGWDGKGRWCFLSFVSLVRGGF